MAEKRDYYEVLGVDKNATEDELKSAYRKKAKMWHPDLHPGDAEAEKNFKEVNEAYGVLSDKEKRSRYDRFGHAGVDPSYGGGATGGGYTTNIDFGDLGDIFGSFFGGAGGGARRRSSAIPGSDVSASVTLEFNEAVFGCQKTVNVRRMEKCEECDGSGAAKGTQPTTCPTCNGTGVVRQVSQTLFGAMQTERPCSNCHGTGKIIKDPCKVCGGRGEVRKECTINVKVPAGINNNNTLTMRGQGDTGLKGGPNGDLNISVKVKPHPIFVRKDNDLCCDVPITLAQAVLGDTIQIPTLDGDPISYKIPEGTQSHTVTTFKGRGVPYINNPKSRGSLVVTFIVEIPRNLSSKQKDIIKEFDTQTTGKTYEKSRSFWNKVKDVFDK